MAHLERGRGLLLVNPRSGRQDSAELEQEARQRGIAVHVLQPEDDLRQVARTADGPLGVAGGDGSLGAVAQLAIERDVPFVCVPFGTRNHFARDVGLDRRDPNAALDAFASTRERRIDVGRVGSRVFLNNVSIGLYARLVHRREKHRRRRDAFARARALWLAARHRHPKPFVLDGEHVQARVVLFANNAYEINMLDLGARTRLDAGSLHAYLAADWLPHTWDERAGERFTLEHADGIPAAVDGEPVHLDSPVELAIEPRALRILLP